MKLIAVSLIIVTVLFSPFVLVGVSKAQKVELTVPNSVACTGLVPGPDMTLLPCDSLLRINVRSPYATANATTANGARINYSSFVSTTPTKVNIECSPASGSQFPIGNTTVNCTARDDNNNTAKASFLVEIVDRTAPVIEVLSKLVAVNATGVGGAVVNYKVIAKDDVSTKVNIECSPVSGSQFPIGNTTVNCTARDDNNNTAKASFVTVVEQIDRTAPKIQLPPGPIFVNATGVGGAVVNYKVIAKDDVSTKVNIECSPVSGSQFPIGNTTVNCTARDDNNNTAKASFVTVVEQIDRTAPKIQLPPGPIFVNATGVGGAVVNYKVIAKDDVSTKVNIECSPVSGSQFPIGNTTVNCTARDDNNNTAKASFVTVVEQIDRTAPKIQLPPGPIFVNATGVGGAVVNYKVIAKDDVSTKVNIECSPVSGSQFPIGNTTVNCTARDDNNNTAKASFVTVVEQIDRTAPKIQLPPGPIFVNATGVGGAVVNYKVIAKDDVSTKVNIECSPVSGSQFPIGNTTVNCTARDDNNNTAKASFVTVVEQIDRTAPKIQLPPGPIFVNATGVGGAVVNYKVIAKDDVSTKVNIECSPVSGSQFPIGNTTVNCTARDDNNNTAKASFVTVVEQIDRTAPKIQLPPGPIFVNATGVGGAVVNYKVIAKDDVSTKVNIECSPVSGSQFPIGNTTVNCTARDDNNNTAKASFVTVVEQIDRTAPKIQLPPGPIFVNATGVGGAVVNYKVIAKDDVSTKVNIECSPVSGSQFPIGNTTVNCTARDDNNNTAKASFVTVVEQIDRTAPKIQLPPGPIFVNATGVGGAVVNYKVIAKDDVSTKVNIECSPVSGSQFPIGNTTVNCTARDDNNNTAKASFVTVVEQIDRTAPKIQLPPGPIFVNATGVGGAVVNYKVIAKDDVSTKVNIECSPVSGSQFPIGNTTVNCTARDDNNNTAKASFVTVVEQIDRTAPKIQLPPGPIFVNATGVGGAVVNYKVIAKDDVSTKVNIECSPVSGSQFPIGNTTVNCTARDDNNNTAKASFVTVVEQIDRTAPKIQLPPGPIFVNATGVGGAVVNYKVIAKDDVSTKVNIECSPVSGSQFPIGNTTVNCTARDDNNNTAKASFVTVVEQIDRTAPKIQLPPGPIFVNATGVGGAVVNYKVIAKDDVSTKVNIECSPVSGSQFPIGNTTVNCTARDDNNNTAKASFVAIVVPQVTVSERTSFSDSSIILTVSLVIIAGAVVGIFLVSKRKHSGKYGLRPSKRKP